MLIAFISTLKLIYHRNNMYKIKENVIVKANISGQERNCIAF